MDFGLFSGLPREELSRLVAAARRRTFERHEVVFHRGDPGDTLHLIAKGRFAVRISTQLGDTATLARGLAATALWNLRVLAGWQPTRGVAALRLLAGWFEIANVDEHLQALRGRPADPPFQLGTLATAWPRLAATGSTEELRAVLAASPATTAGGASGAPSRHDLARTVAAIATQSRTSTADRRRTLRPPAAGERIPFRPATRSGATGAGTRR